MDMLLAGFNDLSVDKCATLADHLADYSALLPVFLISMAAPVPSPFGQAELTDTLQALQLRLHSQI